jgi:HEAT repeat protein
MTTDFRGPWPFLFAALFLAAIPSCNRPGGGSSGGSGLSHGGRSLEAWIDQLGGSFVPNEIMGSPPAKPALDAIAAIGPPAVPVLQSFLTDSRWFMRCAAAAGLGCLGASAAPAGPALATLLHDDVEHVRTASADALANIAPNLAVQALTDPSMMVRIAAARAVLVGGVKGSADDTAVGVLREGMQQHRYQAVQAAGVGRAGELLPELRSALVDQSLDGQNMRGAAVIALEQLGPAALPAAGDLVLELRSRDVNRGGAAARALGAIGAEVIPLVAPLLSDSDAEVRKLAVWAVIALGPKAAGTNLPLKEMAQNDPDEIVRYNARRALETVGGSK